MTQADKSNWIPLLLWSYTVSTAPFLMMLSKDLDSLSSILTVFFCELGYLVLMIAYILFTSNIYLLGIIFFLIMLIPAIIQAISLIQILSADNEELR